MFGLRNQMLEDYKELGTKVIKSFNDVYESKDSIVQEFTNNKINCYKLTCALGEITLNAIFHSTLKEDGTEKYGKIFKNFNLEEDEFVYITYGYDTEKYGVSILDNKGTLKKETILKRLAQTEGGVRMSWEDSDQMIVNIEKGKSTEFIFLGFFDNIKRNYIIEEV